MCRAAGAPRSTGTGTWGRGPFASGHSARTTCRRRGRIDANFAGTPQFALAGEADRPVFVTPAAIDPASGAVSAAGARRSSDYGRVAVRTSQLRGYGGQLTFQVAPDMFKFRRVPGQPYVSLAYTLQSARREFLGFDGGGFGDPRDREWGPAASDARHAIILQGGVRPKGAGVFTLFARAQSGLPFTPIVQGDVNGDGQGGDRAFIPSLAAGGDADDDGAAACAPRRWLRRGAELCAAVRRSRGDAQRMSRTVDGVVQRAVASANPAALGEPAAGDDLHAERAGRSGPAPARRRRPARLGRPGHRRSGAPRPARLRRRHTPLCLRREPALRRHARRQYARAEPVPPHHRFLVAPVDRLQPPGAAPSARAGARREALGAPHRRFARRLLPQQHLRHPSRAPRRERFALPEPAADRCAAPRRLALRDAGARRLRPARRLPRAVRRWRGDQGGARQREHGAEGVLAPLLAAARGSGFHRHPHAARR